MRPALHVLLDLVAGPLLAIMLHGIFASICGILCCFWLLLLAQGSDVTEQVPGVALNNATRGRKYSCVPSWRLGQDGAAPDPFAPTTQKTAPQQRVSRASHTWNVTLHGTADMDTTLTPAASCKNITFQPDIELSISNVGATPVVNPRVVSNGRRRWFNMTDIIAEAHAGAQDDTDRMFFGWDYLRQLHYHSYPLFGGNELHDPVKYFNMYGTGFCDDAGNNFVSLNFHANFTAQHYGQDPKLRSLNGHVQGEIFFSNAYHFMDIDENMFYLDHENDKVVSGDDVAADHDLGKREHTWQGPKGANQPSAKQYSGAEQAIALFGRDDVGGHPHVSGHSMDFVLRPGEKLVLRWDNIGKVAADHNVSRISPEGGGLIDNNGPLVNGFFGNSRIEWSPERGLLDTAAGRPFDVSTPWVICGGRVSAKFASNSSRRNDGAQCSIGLSVTPSKQRDQVWGGSCNSGHVDAELDHLLQLYQGPDQGVYNYSLHFTFGEDITLEELAIVTDVMAHPLSLPRLNLGENMFKYSDDSTTRDILIEHRYQETSLPPLQPPNAPTFPLHRAIVRRDNATFEWPPVDGAEDYHLVVSLREDMRVPYRSQLDTIVPNPSVINPWLGLFSPRTTYFWRIRVKNFAGLWSQWSPTWSFEWRGPGVPMVAPNLSMQGQSCGYVLLQWNASQKVHAEPAVKFEVYGDNETGFTPRRVPRPVLGLEGEQPSNLITTVHAPTTELIVPALTQAFYRVVAIDAAGTRSGASRMASVLRPVVYSCPPTTITPGGSVSYTLLPSLAFGDLQFREPPNEASDQLGQHFVEREGANFTAYVLPSWLKLIQAPNGTSALLTGTAPHELEVGGTTDVAVLLTIVYPYDCSPSGQCDVKGPWSKKKPGFEKSAWHNFTVETMLPREDTEGHDRPD